LDFLTYYRNKNTETEIHAKKQKVLGLQMVLGLRFSAGAATSSAGAAAPAAPALAMGLLPCIILSSSQGSPSHYRFHKSIVHCH